MPRKVDEGARNAAILMLSIGEERAAALFRRLRRRLARTRRYNRAGRFREAREQAAAARARAAARA